MTSSKTPDHSPLVPLRLALIVLATIIIGALIGTVSFFATHSPAQALLAGIVAAGAALLPLDKVIGR